MIYTVVGARPNFMKAAPIHRAFERAGVGASADPHGPALRRGDVEGVLRRARDAAARSSTSASGPDRTRSRRAPSWWGSRSSAPSSDRRRSWWSATSTAPWRPRWSRPRWAIHDGARRGRAALGRPDHARGDQPRRHGRPRRSAAHALARRGPHAAAPKVARPTAWSGSGTS